MMNIKKHKKKISMFYNNQNNTSKPSLSDFKSVYPNSKQNRNIYKIWRWLVIGKLSFYVSWLAARMRLHPNQITYLSFIIGLIGIYLLLLGGTKNFIIGTIGINIWYLLDCSDGHLARYYKIKSNFGKFLDEGFGEIVMTFVWLGIGIGLYKNPDISIIFISDLLGISSNEYILISGAIASISIALRNCISGRFSANYVIKTKNSSTVNVSQKSFYYRWFKIYWTNFMGIGGLQGPLLIITSITGHLGLLLIIYSSAYFSYLIISVIYFIHKFNKSNL